jgi:hypothetical protein
MLESGEYVIIAQLVDAVNCDLFKVIKIFNMVSYSPTIQKMIM